MAQATISLNGRPATGQRLRPVACHSVSGSTATECSGPGPADREATRPAAPASVDAAAAVAMTRRLSSAFAIGIAATQYAAVLPVPVPASIAAMRRSPSGRVSVRAMVAIISR